MNSRNLNIWNINFLITAVMLIAPSNLICNSGEAYIENPQIIGSQLFWEIHFKRLDEWTFDSLSNAFGSSSISFNFNNYALTSPNIVLDTGSVLNNSNYNTSIQAIGNKCIVDINFTFDSLIGMLPLNNKIKLITISMQITDQALTANVSWDALNTGFFDNADQNINVSLYGSFDDPLPVELISFSASIANNDDILLKWKTKTEVDNFGFEVQRQINDNKNVNAWQVLGFVEGSGNSNSPKEYSFIDKEPTGGSIFSYRLKQIDNDGNFTYSKEIEIELNPVGFELHQNYPNPFNSKTTIKFTIAKMSSVKLKIYDLLGQEIKALINNIVLPAGRHKYEFDASGLASGVYIYLLETADNLSAKKLLHLK